MLIGSRTKRPKNSKLIKSGAEHRLQIYKVPPKDTVTLQEFEEYAVERLKGNHWLHYFVRGVGDVPLKFRLKGLKPPPVSFKLVLNI